jgi:hypothetical protein
MVQSHAPVASTRSASPLLNRHAAPEASRPAGQLPGHDGRRPQHAIDDGARHHQQQQDKLEQQHAFRRHHEESHRCGLAQCGLDQDQIARDNRRCLRLCDICATCGTEHASAVCISGDTRCFPELRVPSLGACGTSLSRGWGVPVSVVQRVRHGKWRWGWVDCGGCCWPSRHSWAHAWRHRLHSHSLNAEGPRNHRVRPLLPAPAPALTQGCTCKSSAA